jgi:hypothetical protein
MHNKKILVTAVIAIFCCIGGISRISSATEEQETHGAGGSSPGRGFWHEVRKCFGRCLIWGGKAIDKAGDGKPSDPIYNEVGRVMEEAGENILKSARRPTSLKPFSHQE